MFLLLSIFEPSAGIHLLGLGSLGKLVAYHLAGIPNRPPISLLFHKWSTKIEWFKSGEAIEIERHGEVDRRHGYDIERSVKPSAEAYMRAEAQAPIHNLIVTLKAGYTVFALSSIAHRLTPDSTILFLHNGMGVLDQVNERVFPDVETRPNYMTGIVSHGVYSKSTFKAEHAGLGSIALSVIPKVPFEKEFPLDQQPLLLPQSSRYMLRTLTRTPMLAAITYPPSELFQLQLEKLAVNAVVNPLTAILGCRNGDLLNATHATRIMRLLLAEISLVFRNLPEIQAQPNIQTRFSAENLEHRVVNVMQDTAGNVSSMLQDIQRNQFTEILYINGWIVQKGEEMGFRCIVNYAIMQLVQTKTWITATKGADELPLEGPEEDQ
ncbi:hypothetical protein MMC10_011380 [Thelotrema lepadinum]|nr:hypothetical protein [Thelotrema lepadinum]